ncbi:hypothetical protein GX48_00724 [Paracoccidioides brasiliensis]|nr:hypothetical protein GX48_00724 [Paracoccidioides brasiliensis]
MPARTVPGFRIQVMVPVIRQQPRLRNKEFLSPKGRPPLLSHPFPHVKRASSFVPTLRAPPSSPSAYTGLGSPDVNEGVVEIAVIPWGENRPYQLTINLALFRFRHTGICMPDDELTEASLMT